MLKWNEPLRIAPADFGELPISSMTKNYLEAAIEIAREAGKILVQELSRPLDIAYKGDEVDLVRGEGVEFRVRRSVRRAAASGQVQFLSVSVFFFAV